MGDVKDAVKGTPRKSKKKKSSDNGNLQQRVASLMDDVSDCIIQKDDDVHTEGDAAKAENMRKAGLLRAVHTLLACSKNLLEDY